jgi:hypothetical protein
MQPTCPKCGAAIESNAVNASTDIAHCKACNTIHKLSELTVELEFTEALADGPPPGARSRETIDGWEVACSMRSIPGAIGLGFATIFWNSIVSVFLVIVISRLLNLPPGSQMKEEGTGQPMSIAMAWFMMLFLTPFILVGAGLICGFLCMVLGRTVVRKSVDRGSVWIGIGFLGWSRRFDPSWVTSVTVEHKPGGSESKPTDSIVIHWKHKLKFGSSLSDERRTWMAAELRRRLLYGGSKL